MANTMVTERARLASDDQRWRMLAARCPPEMATLIRSPRQWEVAIRDGSSTSHLVGDVAALVRSYGDNLELATKTALKWLPQVATGDVSVDDARIQVTYAATLTARTGTATREVPWDPHYPDWSERESAAPLSTPPATVVPFLNTALRHVGRDSVITPVRADAIESDAQIAGRHLWEVGASTGRQGASLLAAVRCGRFHTLSPTLEEPRLTALFVGTATTGTDGALLWWWGRDHLGDTTPIPVSVVTRWAQRLERIYDPATLHGNYITYCYRKCRCPECRTAWRDYMREKRAA